MNRKREHPTPRIVEPVHPDYQPSKAEPEEELPPLAVQYPGITAQDVARALTSPVEVRYVPRPKQ